MKSILPGATIGILGGGQLGRMTAMAAISAGYKVHVLDPDPHCPAAMLAETLITAPFGDDEAAAELARNCDVVTFEIEKIPIESMIAAERHAPVRPGFQVLEVIQDRARQKAWLEAHGFPIGPYKPAMNKAQLLAGAHELGGAAFIKATSGGYDGRSQVYVKEPTAALEAWKKLGELPSIIEEALDLDREISVLVARNPNKEIAIYPPALNHHEERILDWSALPATLDAQHDKMAREIARGIAEEFRIEGLIVVEMFLLRDGRLLVNELAPRTHNSFHSTQRGCATSQFEQAFRSVCNLPLGSTEVLHPAAIVNLLGDLWLGNKPPDFSAALIIPTAQVHLYGKPVPRPGRKMGHISTVGGTTEEAVARAREARAKLGVPVMA
jgi:5-(carboxyamino)imidazole ribonucleotide synthase